MDKYNSDIDYNKTGHGYSNRFIVRIYSFAFAVMLIGAGFFVSGINEKKKLERETAAVYSRAFSELVDYVCSINISLEKMTYATNPAQIAAISFDLFSQAGFAKSDIGQLPIDNINLSNMQAFLSQSGDYAYNLTQKAIKTNNISDEDRENLNMLLDYSQKLAEQLVAMQDGINKSAGSGEILRIIQSDLNGPNVPALSNFNEIGHIFSDYPALIYDGSFFSGNIDNANNTNDTNNIEDMPYKMLGGEKELTVGEARAKASEFCGVPENKLKSAGTTESDSLVSTYNFAYDDKFIRVSKKGGYIVDYLVNRRITGQFMSDGDALNTAKAFLGSVIPNAENSLKEVYYIIENGMMIINLAAVQEGVILYPDLIRIGVALDNGEILFYEASGYLQNHIPRNFLKNVVTPEEAVKAVSPMLKINAVGMAVIRTDSKKEIYCYEFKCVNAYGKEYLVYVNAETGLQEDMLVVL